MITTTKPLNQNKMTAVEWLADEIIMLEEKLRLEEININDFMDAKDELVFKALVIEKQQHRETWEACTRIKRFLIDPKQDEEFKQKPPNETFKSE